MRRKSTPQTAPKRILKLRALRRSREMTQGELARRVGLTKSFISEIESGNAKPSLTKAGELAAEFGVSIEEAFSLVEVPA